MGLRCIYRISAVTDALAFSDYSEGLIQKRKPATLRKDRRHKSKDLYYHGTIFLKHSGHSADP
jgi:hypothetical protein